MSVNDSRAKLSRSTKDLLNQWHRVQSSWRDENSQQFYETVLEPLQQELRKTEIAMERIDSMINQIKHQCK